VTQRKLLNSLTGKTKFLLHLIGSTTLIVLALYLLWWAYKIWTY
jgi:hypothetical protein